MAGPGLACVGIGESEFVVRIAGEGPRLVMDLVVVVPAQPGKVAHDGEPAVGIEDHVVDFVDASVTTGDAAVVVANLNGAAKGV